MKAGNIVNRIIEGEEKTCILLGGEDLQPPKHMMQGEKQKGVLFLNGDECPWTWTGLCTIEGSRYVYFDKIDIEPFDSIASLHRDKALSIILTIARILTQRGEKFASTIVNIIPTYRFFIVNGGDGVLILPPDLGDLISIYLSEEDRYSAHGCYIKNNTEAGFSLIRQFAQFMYFALTGIKPYEDISIRQSGCHDIPLEIYKEGLFPSLSDETIGFINFVMHAKERDQRDIMGNRSACDNLSWFISKASSLDWSVSSIDEATLKARSSEIASSGKSKSLMEKIEKEARRKNFWRQKGSIIITASVVFVVVAAILFSYISNLLEPPYTKDMNQVEMIQAFYEAQNNLNVDDLSDALDGCSAPQESEVINLYVTRQTRSAYEGVSPFIPVDDWIEAGRPAISITSSIYGVTDLEITQTGENSYHVEGTYYTPYPYNEEDQADISTAEDKSLVYVYSMSQDFTFAWNKRGWWNITDVSAISVKFTGTLLIDTFNPREITVNNAAN